MPTSAVRANGSVTRVTLNPLLYPLSPALTNEKHLRVFVKTTVIMLTAIKNTVFVTDIMTEVSADKPEEFSKHVCLMRISVFRTCLHAVFVWPIFGRCVIQRGLRQRLQTVFHVMY